MLKGIPAAPGVAIGKAYCFGSVEVNIPKRKINVSDIPKEIVRFEEALIETRKEIIEIQNKISKEMSTKHGEIFNAHLLVLEDRMLIEEVINQLKKEKFSIEYIFSQVIKKYIQTFSEMDDQYLRERLSDIDDVGRRILRHLTGVKGELLSGLKEKRIVVAYNLSPSDTAQMHRENVIGFVTDIGGQTSHTAIMAKALEIPAVVGTEQATARIRNDDLLIVDGTHGIVVINPDKEILKKYEQDRAKFARIEQRLLNLRDLPALTKDNHRIHLAANIELPEEIPSVLAHGAEGIGLYRTEYFYMNRTDLPSEDEHFMAYKKVAKQMAPHPVVIRTLDLGGDKFISQLEVPQEMNPYLGWRAIRFCLAQPEIFLTQLRAVLRASIYGKLKLMYPMISGVEELRQANQLLKTAKEELKKKNIPFNDDIEVGAMIEIPSAALTCDIIATEADFFSIGTNDLIQYSIAVDRVNEKIAYLYEPTHPAVLRLIKNIIDTAHKANIQVGMCGEMAGEPEYALLLLGLGLDEFSAYPAAIPEIKQIIRSVKLSDTEKIARQAMCLSTGKEVKEFAQRKFKELILEVKKT